MTNQQSQLERDGTKLAEEVTNIIFNRTAGWSDKLEKVCKKFLQNQDRVSRAEEREIMFDKFDKRLQEMGYPKVSRILLPKDDEETKNDLS